MSAFWDKVVAMRKRGRQLTQKGTESAPVADAVVKPDTKKKKTSAKAKVETEIKADADNFDISETVVVCNDRGTDKDS